MPYSRAHKRETRARIIEAARILFNREGFAAVTIDRIMAAAGLTRGGFYNHFRNKEELYAEAVESFLTGRGLQWREESGAREEEGSATVRAMLDGYLSTAHLDDLDGQCPMIALPSDVARGTPEVRAAYLLLLRAMTGLFERNLPRPAPEARQTALALSALCVGGMVLARTIDDAALSRDLLAASRAVADRLGAAG